MSDDIILLPDESHQAMLRDAFDFERETKKTSGHIKKEDKNTLSATFEADGRKYYTAG